MIDNPAVAMVLLLVLWAAAMYALARHERRTDARLTGRKLRRRRL